ncbi:MAG: hypothetical protein ABIK31_07500 [candidate division WOR-3 bacterium]
MAGDNTEFLACSAKKRKFFDGEIEVIFLFPEIKKHLSGEVVIRNILDG